LGTIYVSGIASDIEDVIRYWASRRGVPHHTIMSIFYRTILARPWTAFVVPSVEMELQFREKLHEMLRANPKLQAAVGQNFPEQGRIPSLVELVSPEAVGKRLEPVFGPELKELEEARRSILSKAKRALKDVIEAEEDDE
jgi:hypothetical protein